MRPKRTGWDYFSFQQLPLMVVLAVPREALSLAVAGSSLVLLAALGAVAAHTGGDSAAKGAWRAAFWGALAMAVTAGIGTLFETVQAEPSDVWHASVSVPVFRCRVGVQTLT